jgi:hypothetical protein
MMMKQYTNTQRTAVENKITTITAQEVSLAKVKDQNSYHIFYKHGENPQRICD